MNYIAGDDSVDKAPDSQWIYASRVRIRDHLSNYHGREYCRHGEARAHSPRFLEANIKSLIFTIGAPPQILMPTPAYANYIE